MTVTVTVTVTVTSEVTVRRPGPNLSYGQASSLLPGHPSKPAIYWHGAVSRAERGPSVAAPYQSCLASFESHTHRNFQKPRS